MDKKTNLTVRVETDDESFIKVAMFLLPDVEVIERLVDVKGDLYLEVLELQSI